MKNLKIYSALTTENDNEIVKELQGVEKMCADSSNGVVYFIVGNNKLLSIDKQKHVSIINEIHLSECGEENNLLQFDCLSHEQKLSLIYQHGQIYTFDIEERKLEKVYEFGKNIAGCAWSPDGQLLVVGTESHLHVLSKASNVQDGPQDLKILVETPLRPTSSGKDQLVTIGWGSAESQFQGSTGKHGREKQNPNKIPVSIRSEFDDRRMLISWRADGQYFVVSSVDDIFVPKKESPSKNILLEKLNCRQLRVWNRDLELMSQCEFLSGMGMALSVRPVGNLIAVPCILENQPFIWFFERNGQYRSKFRIPNAADELVLQTSIRNLSWNLDGTVLALYCENAERQTNQLQFWTVSNYSWTEKIRLDVEELVDMFWDAEIPNKFHYLTASGHYHHVLMHFEYNCEDILALSINGGKGRVTDLKMATIPPPLCHTEIAFEYCGTPSAFALSSIFGLALVGSDYQRMTIFHLLDRNFVHHKDIRLSGGNDGGKARLLYNLVWRNATSILAIRNGQPGSVSTAAELVSIDLETGAIELLQNVPMRVYAHFMVDSAPNLSKNPPNNLRRQIVQINGEEDGTMGRSLLLGEETTADERFCRMKVFETEKKEVILLSLTNNLLFINHKRLHLSITSFCFSNKFIILLTLDNNLYCLPLDAILDFLADDSFDSRKLFNSGRSVERGAQLLACEPNGTRVWLQMPRGNLEMISPRSLVLESLKRHLDKGLWERAFLEMRQHRVDMNLLYDHNPKVFNENLADFINQIGNVDHLNLFLTSLKPQDTTLDMFAAQYTGRSQADRPRRTDGKVNGICEKIRNSLLGIGDEKQKILFYPAVLTTFLMEKPSRVSAALVNMRDYLAQLNGESSPQMVQRWLRHIGYMVTEDVLFKQALKTYDLEIALIVAQSTNLDPKEYLPVLNEIRQSSPKAFQCFHIDNFLEDWPSALEHITNLVQEEPQESTYLEKCLGHIQAHNLHQQALKLFCGKPHYKDVCKLAAQAFEGQGLLKEAALLFEKGEDYVAAQNCLFSVQDFHGYIRLTKKTDQPEEKLEIALKKMLVQLEHREQHKTAAELLVRLGKEKNAEKIVDCHSRAGSWTELVEFVEELGGERLANRGRVAISTRCAQIVEQIDGWRDAIGKHSKRLDLLREEKAAKMKQILDGTEHEGGGGFMDDDGTCSQTSNISLNSRQTQVSTASRRRRRHIERKKQQVKEGSQWEDAAILVHLKAVYSEIDGQQEELVQLLPALFSLDLVDKGRRIQGEMLAILGYASSLIDKIWPEHLEPWNLPGPLTEIYRDKDSLLRWPSGGGELMPSRVHLEEEIQRPKLNSAFEWKMSAFE